MKAVFFTLLIIFAFFNFSKFVFGDELDIINNQINELNTALSQSKAATAPHETELNRIKSRITFIEQDLIKKATEIDQGYKNLAAQKESLDKTIANFYVKSYYNSPFILFLSAPSSALKIIQNLAFQKALADQDREKIVNFALLLTDLGNQQKSLESEQIRLDDVKIKLDKLVSGAKAYQATLSNQIAVLSAKQQAILNQRLSALGIPRSAGASSLYCTDDRKIDPGFSSGFAFFTYGIPHYIGMNQYGAYGRAKDNQQDYKTILNAYFQNISIECRDIPASIDVQGYDSMNFEDYIKGVVNKEMGADLPEALKAQAIAARSFAMNETKPICTSQSCQVYSNDRRDAANNAVDATGVNACGAGKAEFVVANGSIAKTWYASTFGGYAHTSGQIWGGNTSYTKNFADTTGPISSFSDLSEKAYDKESKCFYTAQGWRNEHGKSAWLKPEEVADIVNTLLLVKADSSAGEHLYQTDKPNPAGTDTWDSGRIKQELQKINIAPYNSVSSISVNADFNSGVTTRVHISGDGQAIPDGFDGNEFKNRFNLRAPANIQIVGPLYNIERN